MKTIITGQLTLDPEIRYSRDGVAETTLSVEDMEGQAESWSPSNIHTVTVTGELAENVALSCVKGQKVVLTGVESRGLVAANVAVSLASATAEVTRTRRPDTAERFAEDGGRGVDRAEAIDADIARTRRT
jgi:hypothetical protein